MGGRVLRRRPRAVRHPPIRHGDLCSAVVRGPRWGQGPLLPRVVGAQGVMARREHEHAYLPWRAWASCSPRAWPRRWAGSGDDSSVAPPRTRDTTAPPPPWLRETGGAVVSGGRRCGPHPHAGCRPGRELRTPSGTTARLSLSRPSRGPDRPAPTQHTCAPPSSRRTERRPPLVVLLPSDSWTDDLSPPRRGGCPRRCTEPAAPSSRTGRPARPRRDCSVRGTGRPMSVQTGPCHGVSPSHRKEAAMRARTRAAVVSVGTTLLIVLPAAHALAAVKWR